MFGTGWFLNSNRVRGMIRLSRLLFLVGFLLVVNVFTILLINQGQRGTGGKLYDMIYYNLCGLEPLYKNSHDKSTPINQDTVH